MSKMDGNKGSTTVGSSIGYTHRCIDCMPRCNHSPKSAQKVSKVTSYRSKYLHRKHPLIGGLGHILINQASLEFTLQRGNCYESSGLGNSLSSPRKVSLLASNNLFLCPSSAPLFQRPRRDRHTLTTTSALAGSSHFACQTAAVMHVIRLVQVYIFILQSSACLRTEGEE